jgi:hypothetical protein
MMIRCVGRNTVDTICHYSGSRARVSNQGIDTGVLSSWCNPPARRVLRTGGGALFDVERTLDDVAWQRVATT